MASKKPAAAPKPDYKKLARQFAIQLGKSAADLKRLGLD